jgi:hypothetical protein
MYLTLTALWDAASAPGHPVLQKHLLEPCNYRHFGDATFSIFTLQLSSKGVTKTNKSD